MNNLVKRTARNVVGLREAVPQRAGDSMRRERLEWIGSGLEVKSYGICLEGVTFAR